MAQQEGDPNHQALDVSPAEFKSIRLAIGTVDKTILEISLSDDLTETRHIEIRLPKQQKNNRRLLPGPGDDEDQPPAASSRQVVIYDAAAAANTENATPPPAPQAADRRRLEITVKADDDDDDDYKFQENRRGWLMTVATLFVSMAFQTAVQPPAWMASTMEGWFDALFHRRPATWIHNKQAGRVFAYVFLNTTTFTTALAVVLLLLLMKKSWPKHAMTVVTWFIFAAATSVGTNFANSFSGDDRVIWLISGVMFLEAVVVFFYAWSEGLYPMLCNAAKKITGRLP